MNSSLCKLNVQIAEKWFCLIFDALIVSYFMSAIVAVKNEKCEARFKSSLGPSSPISEITTSHVCRLKRQETQLFKNQVFF